MVTLRAYIWIPPYRSIYRSFKILYCASCDISPSNFQAKHSIEEFCRITRRVDPINNHIKKFQVLAEIRCQGAINPPNFLHKMCMCFYVGIKKFEDTTTNNPLSLLRPPSSNNQLWPLRRRIASRRGFVSVGDGVGVGCSGGGGRGQHEDDGNDNHAMTML